MFILKYRIVKLIFIEMISVGKEHTHHNHISRSASDSNNHAHDIHETKQMKVIFEEARAKFANLIHDEKKNITQVRSGQPESFHNMLFRYAPY